MIKLSYESIRTRLHWVLTSKSMFAKVWNNLKRTCKAVIKLYKNERFAQVGIIILIVYAFLAIFGPTIAPYDPFTSHRGPGGSVLRTAPPSTSHWLGTTHQGRDVFTQLLYGARISMGVGLAAAFMAVFIGANVGLVSAYFGGKVDDLLMRMTDIAYGLPFLPFVLVFIYVMGTNLINIILVIGLVQWRGSARVVRSEVLSQKERPYVESARAIGASDMRIMYRHIFPNVVPIVSIYIAFAVAIAVIAEASIAFLGFGDPDVYSWGRMMHYAYQTGAAREAWWWILPPGLLIVLLVTSVFFIGQALDKFTNPEIAKGGAR